MKLKIFLPFALVFVCSDAFCLLPSSDNADWAEKARAAAARNVPAPANKNSSTLSLIRPNQDDVLEEDEDETLVPHASAAASNPQKQPVKQLLPRQTAMQQPAAQNAVKTQKNGIQWIDSSMGHFNIKIERRKTGIMTPNLAMKFETVYQILSSNISWMMGGKADVYVYQSRDSFLRNEPVADGWSGAFFSPSENRIVMYDEPSNESHMLSHFTHELTHLFVEHFFNPSSRQHRLDPPIWMNEGLAVNMEDISANYRGGTWASDLVVINIFSSGDRKKFASQGGTIHLKDSVSSKVVFFRNFGEFLNDSSYDNATQNGWEDDWYFQAYAMIRFLFKPYNAMYPEKRIQFEQFTRLLNTYSKKYDKAGRPVTDAQGRIIMQRTPVEDALRQAYGYRNINDFENKFWLWLTDVQKTGRYNLRKGRGAL